MTQTTEIFLSAMLIFWIGPMCFGFVVAAILHLIRKIKEGRDE